MKYCHDRRDSRSRWRSRVTSHQCTCWQEFDFALVQIMSVSGHLVQSLRTLSAFCVLDLLPYDDSYSLFLYFDFSMEQLAEWLLTASKRFSYNTAKNKNNEVSSTQFCSPGRVVPCSKGSRQGGEGVLPILQQGHQEQEHMKSPRHCRRFPFRLNNSLIQKWCLPKWGHLSSSPQRDLLYHGDVCILG